MSAMDSNSKTNNAAHEGWLLRLVRRLSIWVEGSDYKDRFMRLAEQYALSDIIGQRGWFRPTQRGRWGRHSPRGKGVDCIITGGVMRLNGDYLIINYTTEDGDYIEGAEIPRSAFRQSSPNDERTRGANNQ